MSIENLIIKLSEYSSDIFDEWVIARAIYNNFPEKNTGIIKINKLYAKITVSNNVSSLSIILMNPANICKSTHSDNIEKYDTEKFSHCFSFSKSDIRNFVNENKDTNPIHRTKNPVVPGLLILKYLFEKSAINKVRFNSITVTFKRKIYSDEKIYIIYKDDIIKGIAENNCCFTAEIK